MDIDVRKRKGVCIIDCGGALTLDAGDAALRNKFNSLLESGERYFVLELARLEYMDSAGVGETVACYKRAAERNGVIKIVVPEKGTIRRIFSITGLDRAFEIFVEEDHAVASFRV